MLDIDPAILFALLLCLMPVANVLGASCCCFSCVNGCAGDRPASWSCVVTGNANYNGTYVCDE
ncbi:MAG TPA: hypothetical protein VMX74_14945, partial [Pirellulales bacterium]|nr:hypothetical protein [Pirellulales bacterium]